MKTRKTEARFSGVLGEDYNLFPASVPYFDEMQDLVRQRVKNFAKELDSPSILFFEAGTGTGLTMIRVLEADPRIHVMAVDNEDKTLSQAQTLLFRLIERITFMESDILEAIQAQPNESLDGFVSAYTVHSLEPEYRKTLFSEVHRTLKRGAMFINADKYAVPDLGEHQKSLHEQIKAFDFFERIGRVDLKEEWTRHYLEDDRTKITKSEQIEALSALGFIGATQIFRGGMDAVILAHKGWTELRFARSRNHGRDLTPRFKWPRATIRRKSVRRHRAADRGTAPVA